MSDPIKMSLGQNIWNSISLHLWAEQEYSKQLMIPKSYMKVTEELILSISGAEFPAWYAQLVAVQLLDYKRIFEALQGEKG